MHRIGDTERFELQSMTTATIPRPNGLEADRPTADEPEETRRRRRSVPAEMVRWAVTLTLFVILAVSLLGASLIAAIYWQARSDQTRQVDAIVVLGAAQYDGRPSPVLEARLEAALAAYEAGSAPLIVVTGGRLEGDRFTEAEASRAYLVDHGVPANAILLENDGHTSWESLQGAARLLHDRDLDRVLLVSDGFHLFRVKLMARDLDLVPFGKPADDSPIRPNSGSEFGYVLREAAGVVIHLWDR